MPRVTQREQGRLVSAVLEAPIYSSLSFCIQVRHPGERFEGAHLIRPWPGMVSTEKAEGRLAVLGP